MRSIEIKLYAAMPGGSHRFTYKHNDRVVDVYRVFDKPHGYIYFNYKSRTLGHFKITKVLDKYNKEQDFGGFLPQDEVINFFVYYSYSFEQPLMICIATMKKHGVVKYHFFTPQHKKSNKWIEEKDIVVDPKWSTSMNAIRQKLDQTFSIMGGVEIHIDIKHDYKQYNIVTREYPHQFKNYRIHTHELVTKREFILNRLRCNNEIISDIEFKNAILAVHVISRNDHHFRPIILCIVEEAKGTNSQNTHHWYSLVNLDSEKWVKIYETSHFPLGTDIEKVLDFLYAKFHEFEIDLNNIFFNSKQYNEYTNNGELFKQVYHESTGYNFSRHVCELKTPFTFNVNTMKIYGTKQTGLPKEMYRRFHVYCHEKNDPYIPVIICVEVKHGKHRWFHVEHFASNNWVEYTNLEDADPDDNDIEEDFEKIYQSLFMVNLDVKYEMINVILKQYNKNNRYLGTRETNHNHFKKIEVVNYSSYPLSVRIHLNEKRQTSIPDIHDVLSVYIFYYVGDKKTLPMFICFEMYHGYKKFVWYSRLQEETDKWLLNEELTEHDPRNFTFEILKNVQEGVYNYQINGRSETEGNGNSSVQNVTGKAVGASFGAAACCGVGYLVYNNAGAILSFFR